MEVYSIDITAPSSSFRPPSLISGAHLTMKVPPISTVLGMINAAAGRYLLHEDLTLGYYFEYGAMAEDLQVIRMRETGSGGRLTGTFKNNVIVRQFLYKPFIRIYCEQEAIINYLMAPVYPLTIGRGELARADINSVHKRILSPIKNADKICGQIVPFAGNDLPGLIQALPIYHTNTLPRENLGMRPFTILDHKEMVASEITAYRDTIRGKEVDIYFHQIRMEELY